MSKNIKLTDDVIRDAVSEFKESLKKYKASDGKISYSKNLLTVDEKATLVFSELAYLKMMALVDKFSSEVAWHGIAYRDDDNVYYVTDILIYPQEVTGVTVDTDQERYTEWLMSQDDEVFNNIRFQGHSHVNMGTTPSSVDLGHQREMLDPMPDDDFYIFAIWNKKNEHTVKIYDMGKNILFENDDITVEIEGELGVCQLIEEADDMVSKKAYNNSFGKAVKKVEPKNGSKKNSDKQEDDEPYDEIKGYLKEMYGGRNYNPYAGYYDYGGYYSGAYDMYDDWEDDIGSYGK